MFASAGGHGLIQRLSKHAFGLALVLLTFGAIFGLPLWRSECPAYRDAGHFYFPTLVYTTQQWSAGEVPLWNPFDNAGQPLAADATSAVFYPGRAVLHLPLTVERRITLFVALHWLLAVFGARRLAKRITSSTDAQYFAALMFGLSGYVSGQCFNLVFLVGAAWLPWAWDAWESLRMSREPRKAALLAIPLAMMVLGGDPQTAYHVALFALLDSVSWRRTAREAAISMLEPRIAEDSIAPKHLTWPWFRSRWVMLAFACALAVGLAAIQIAPSVTWTMRSDRAVFDQPRSIWEWIASSQKPSLSSVASFVAPPAQNTHDENLYDFSFAPIRVIEFAVPGAFGELGPHYQNWLKALTPSQRWWTNTNYLGLLTLVAALFAIRGQWSSRMVRSASYIALIALLSSFGVWGLGAFWQSISPPTGAENAQVGPAVGGLYWLWVTFLPAYSGFRYPSKWLLFFSLAIALLAARGIDLLSSRDNSDSKATRIRESLLAVAPHLFIVIACLASVVWVCLLLLSPDPFAALAKTSPHALYGPLDVDGVSRCARFALARTFVVSLILAMLFFAMKGPLASLARRGLLLFTLLEVIHAVWPSPFAPNHDYWAKAPVSSSTGPNRGSKYRVYRASSSRLQPANWKIEFDSQRMSAIRHWEQQTLAPRYHWLTGARVIEARGTTMSADYGALLELLHRCPPDDIRETAWTGKFHPLDMLAAHYCIVPKDATIRNAQRLASPAVQTAGVSLWERQATPPRAWVAQSVSLVPELHNSRRAEIAKRTREILLPQNEFRDLFANTSVECDAPDSLFSEICRAKSNPNLNFPKWIVDAPQRIELEVSVDQPSLLVLADAFDPGWSAYRNTDGVGETQIPIYRTNRVLRGVCLPAGHHRVTFVYQPWEIPLGGVISMLSWLIALPGAFLFRLRQRMGRLHLAFRRRATTAE